ncbi:MAG: hypothetical protein GWP70_13160 [Proteobacteria bacterium]|nr:hypothetical protein [Pseudomonadota bacterium]
MQDNNNDAQQAETTESAAEKPVERAQDGLKFIWITAFVVLITAMVLAL